MVWRGVRFVLLTHYQLDVAMVNTDGPFEDFTEQDLVPVGDETRSFADALVSRYEEEALSKKVGDN